MATNYIERTIGPKKLPLKFMVMSYKGSFLKLNACQHEKPRHHNKLNVNNVGMKLHHIFVEEILCQVIPTEISKLRTRL